MKTIQLLEKYDKVKILSGEYENKTAIVDSDQKCYENVVLVYIKEDDFYLTTDENNLELIVD